MSYNFSRGRQIVGDLSGSDDSGRNTGIDFEDDYIGLQTGGTTSFVLSGSKVGIGTTTPDYELDVAGNIGVDQYIYHNGDANTLINFSDDKIILKAGGKAMVTMEEKGSAPHEVTINDGGNNIDFVVKGNGSNAGNPGMKFDASSNRVGINGVGSPIAELDIAGKIAITAESSTPSQPSDGQGYLYTKSDGKIYWRSYDVSETDLTSGGGGGSPGGPDGAVQINNGGSLTGSAGLTHDGTTVFVESTLQVVGEEKLNDSSYSTGEQANRSFTLRRHYNVSISANTLTDVITFRPYLEGTTNDPTGVLHAAVSYRMEIAGLQNGVANGYRSRKGFISYEGSSAANDFASDTTLGSGAITAAVDRSGWVTKLQINANSGGSSGFRGTVFVEIHFPRGGGSNGESIFWSIT